MTPTFSIPNVRLFIAFKVFFNSRFYYPVFTILFLDFGLTIAQFSLLNAAWAATIVLAEVPSGALADIIGRKRLLVFATFTMMVEIGIISFVPKTDPSIIFYIFLINRILSGLAEAAASGADEAIAYDSLAAMGDKSQWGRVLEILMRFQSIGFIVAMSIGAAVYDPNLLESICGALGFTTTFTQQTTMRFPLYLTFILAICAFITTLRMTEPDIEADAEPVSKPDTKPASQKDLPQPVRQAFALTLKAGLWILQTPFALSIILFGMLLDGIIRMIITLSSQYYRMIELPEATFGLIGALVALLGFFVPKMAKQIAESRPSWHGLMVTSSLALLGLVTMNLFLPYAGLIPALITFSAMYFNGFFVSYHINKVTSSKQRATVLSFKGLSYNLAYGVLGVLYALLIKLKKQALAGDHIEDLVFIDTFVWFPTSFVICFFILLIIWRLWLRKPADKR